MARSHLTDDTDSSPSSPHFSRRKTLIFSLLPALLLLGGLESCARIYELWHPPLIVDYGLGFDEESRVFIPAGIHRDTMTTAPQKTISFVRQSFSMPKKDDCFRIVMLGGSNVNYMHWSLLNMVKRLQSRTDGKRQIEVINCGGHAYGSKRLRLVAKETLGYDPDLVLIYSGHNEFEELIHEKLTNIKTIPLQKVAYSLAMLRTVRDFVTTIQLALLSPESLRETLPPEVDVSTETYKFSQDEISKHMAYYHENLSAIISDYQSNNIPVLISTVASNYRDPEIHPSQSDIYDEIQSLYAQEDYEAALQLSRETIQTSARHQASDTENAIIRELAGEYGLPLIEGELLIMEAEPNGIPGETLFGDACHLTVEGQIIVLAAFEEEIMRILNPSNEATK